MHITLIAGARPNFVKIAPIIAAIEKAKSEGAKLNYRLVHTGQHYDDRMSHAFFEDLRIPRPDVNLNCGGGTQAEQTAAIMVAFEADLKAHPTDLILVVGDVNSTLACSIVGKKAGVRLAHVEAGIRSGDWSMPEEINRVVTDALADYYFTTTEQAGDNLLKTGARPGQIIPIGNVMIDTLVSNKTRFRKPDWANGSLPDNDYFVLTLHRPANVDAVEALGERLHRIMALTRGRKVVFPVHPRTAQLLENIYLPYPQLLRVPPLGYLEFNYLVSKAFAVLTDSGGITEETTVLGIPCLTLRDNTERPETIEIGTNELLGTQPENYEPYFDKLFAGQWKKGGIPPLWDGQSAVRLVAQLLKWQKHGWS